MKYLAVARAHDSTVLASLSCDFSIKDKVRCMQSQVELGAVLVDLSSSAASPEWRQKVPSGLGTWYLICDSEEICCITLVRTGYPERHIPTMLEVQSTQEMRTSFRNQGQDLLRTAGSESLTKVMTTEMRRIANKYEDLKAIDKLYAANVAVLEVQGVVQDNIQQVLRNTESLEVRCTQGIEVKTQDLRNTAQVFHGDAKKLERIMYWRNLKLKCILIFVVIAIILYIVIPIVIVKEND